MTIICKDCGQTWSDGNDFNEKTLCVDLKSDTTLCPACLQKRQDEGKPIFD